MTDPKQELVPRESEVSGANALMQIIARAATDPAYDPAKLAALLAVKKDWEADEARKAFVVALNAFKANAPKIIKDKQVTFGTTKYKHALAGNASEQIGAALAEHDISHRWDVVQLDSGLIKVTCILTHAQGHSERVTLQAAPDVSGSKNSIQAIGSTVSYLQRYSMFAATGLVPKDADDDGRGGDEHAMAESTKKDFLAAIEALSDKDVGEQLWKRIADACQKAGDIPSYDELKKAMATKMRGLK